VWFSEQRQKAKSVQLARLAFERDAQLKVILSDEALLWNAYLLSEDRQ